MNSPKQPKNRKNERFFKNEFNKFHEGIGTAYYRVRATDTLGIWVNDETKEVRGLTFEKFRHEKSLSQVVDDYGYARKTEITKKEFTAILKLTKTIF